MYDGMGKGVGTERGASDLSKNESSVSSCPANGCSKIRRGRIRLQIRLVTLSGMLLACSVGAAASEPAPLALVADIPLPGSAVRFDYQSLDVTNNRLYMAHMNADQLVVFDTKKRSVIATLAGFPDVHGVIAVPELNRVYASATGDHRVVVVDAQTLKIIALQGPIHYPDGLA